MDISASCLVDGNRSINRYLANEQSDVLFSSASPSEKSGDVRGISPIDAELLDMEGTKFLSRKDVFVNYAENRYK